MIKTLKHLFYIIIFFAIIFISIPSIAKDKSTPRNGNKYSPIISEKVQLKAEAGEMVAVLIKIKEEWDHPSVKKMTTSDDPAHFISKQGIKTLQEVLETSFTPAEISKDIKIIHRLENIPWVFGMINLKALEKLKVHPNVAIISESERVKSHLVESGPLINADLSHIAGYSGDGVTVAVIDSGIDTDHPDLQGDLLWEECFLWGDGCITGLNRASGPGSAEDGYGHGTHVTGIITSGNENYTGIAPDTKIVAIKVLDDSGNGWTFDSMAALDWIVSNKNEYGISVVNMSFGSSQLYSGLCDDSAPIATAAEAAKAAGIVLFASSGNDGETNNMTAPACLSSVISVGSVYDGNAGPYIGSCNDTPTSADKISCFSNVSSELDLLAPGSKIDSSGLGGDIIKFSGTSMASPHAAALAALILQKNYFSTPDYIKSILLNSGVPIYDVRVGAYFPRVDSIEALDLTVELDDTVTDNDIDGMYDNYEFTNGLNPFDANDANEDIDGDGLTNLDEFYLHSDPNNVDTDNDGVIDGFDGYPLDDQQSSCFDPIINDLINGSTFSSLQDAVNDQNAMDNDKIKITAAHFNESVLYDRELKLILSGGYYCSYLDNPSASSINSLIIRNGTVLADKINIKSKP